jgi:hypothetical protein
MLQSVLVYKMDGPSPVVHYCDRLRVRILWDRSAKLLLIHDDGHVQDIEYTNVTAIETELVDDV